MLHKHFFTFSLLSLVSISQAVPTFLQHHNQEFILHREGKSPIHVQRAFMEKELRGISHDKLQSMVKAGAYLQLNKFKDRDDYSLRLKMRGDGGGAIGATVGCFLGKAAVSVVGHGTIALVSGAVGMFCPPAGVATQIALTSVMAVPIEAASMAAAVGTGALLGALTGPV